MTHYPEFLPSREAQTRHAEQMKKRKQQAVEMNHKWANGMSNRTVRTDTNIDMKDALSKVRQSDVSIPVELSRYQGSYLYNKQT